MADKSFGGRSREYTGKGRDGNESGGSVNGRHRKNQEPDKGKGGTGKRGVSYLITGKEGKK